jgi:Flp pilus assembly protein TadG
LTVRRAERAQASVELALLLPVVVLLALLVVQAAVVARDRVHLVHSARVAARAVVVEPDEGAAHRALQRQAASADRLSVELSGDRSPGGVVTVTVRMRPATVPLVGRVVGGVVLSERLGVLVEG